LEHFSTRNLTLLSWYVDMKIY